MAKKEGQEAPAGEVQICEVCHRDPAKPPPDWKKSPAKWAKLVKVVAFNRCARDYQRFRRGSKGEPLRRGVRGRITAWMTEELQARIEAVAKAANKSTSEWAAMMLEACVTAAEKKAAGKKAATAAH
jgi:hypothetical protein